MSVLVFNAGSSSLKFGLFDETVHETLASGTIDWSGKARQAELTIWSAASGEMRRQLEMSNDPTAFEPVTFGSVDQCSTVYSEIDSCDKSFHVNSFKRRNIALHLAAFSRFYMV